METLKRPYPEDTVLSSSPAFATPLHPVLPVQSGRAPPPPLFKPTIPTILPILLPPATIRPLAFRTFTKRHNLTLNSSALQALATFIGRHCGSGWRDEGTGEKVLEEVAKLWKAENGAVIAEDGTKLKGILKTLEGCMSGGRVGQIRSGSSSRQNSFAFGREEGTEPQDDTRPTLERQGSSFGISGLTVNGGTEEDEDERTSDPRRWLKVISASEQPRLNYDADRKHFITISTKPTLFPSPTHKTALFKQRYHIIHQRLLRNEAFQAPTISTAPARLKRQDSATVQSFYKITPVANLLGRGGTNHLLLGMIVVAPTGTLALNDLSGSISLDLQHATPLQGEGSAYFCPGMIVLVDGMYEEDWVGAGSSGLGNTGGVGGSIGGRFVAFSIGGPPVEKRIITLGIDLNGSDVGGGFGWTDFLGVGSERAVGNRMKKLEERMLELQGVDAESGRNRIVILGEVNLDQPASLSALRKVLEVYIHEQMREPPLAIILTGNFSSQPSLAGASTGSIEYKELFDSLAAVLADFPTLLRRSTFIFVPGANDAWSSSFSAGASTVVPQERVPDVFTSRIRRAFANAKAEIPVRKEGDMDGEAIWTTNPSRVSLFGPQHEIVLFRDDITGRMKRNDIKLGQALGSGIDDDAHVHQSSTPRGEEDITMSGALPSNEDADARIDYAANPDGDESMEARTPTEDGYAIGQAKRLILSLLPQSTLSPFPLQTRPMHWDHSSAMSLYPLPHTLLLCDAEAEPFALTYEGCHVINTGRLVSGGGKRKRVRWAEYDARRKRGLIRENHMG